MKKMESYFDQNINARIHNINKFKPMNASHKMSLALRIDVSYVLVFPDLGSSATRENGDESSGQG